jgi:hypothetical protein
LRGKNGCRDGCDWNAFCGPGVVHWGLGQEAVEESCVDLSCAEIGMKQDAPEEWNIRFDASDKVFHQRAAEPVDSHLARLSVANQFC